MLKILKRHRRFEQKDFYSAEEYVTNLDEALWEKRPPISSASALTFADLLRVQAACRAALRLAMRFGVRQPPPPFLAHIARPRL